MLKVTPVPAFKDNYIWLIHSRKNPARVLAVDPGDAAPVYRALAEYGLTLAGIFVTHHHHDHTGGVAELVKDFNVPVWGPANEAAGVVQHPLQEGYRVSMEGLEFSVLDIPGHTLGHIAFAGEGALFCGDTLFSAGCGRLFEGTPEMMSCSLGKLAVLPDDTAVYCGHEYTEANLRFAATVEPDNPDIAAAQDEARRLRETGQPTLPSRIGREKNINPFLRTHMNSLRQAAEQWSGTPLDDKVRVFAALRRWKDNF